MKSVIFCIIILLVYLCEFSFAAAVKESNTWLESFRIPYQTQRSKSSVIRIVGGDQATPHQFPYQVGLYITYADRTAFCGGSLISQNRVLTAAHCAESAVAIEVILGSQNISDDSESSRQVQITSNYVVHPNWDSSFFVNDVALVKLSKPVVLNKYVQTVSLPSGSSSYAGQQGTVIGWGKTFDAQSVVTDILRFESNVIMSNSACKETSDSYNAIIQDAHLCLSGKGNKGVCKGDSGGPLVTNGVQVGIVSFNYKTCEASMPSVFARVTEFTDWIRNNSDI